MMGSDQDDSLQTRAIEWHVRLRDGGGATWDAFTDWLAQDPRHAKAYGAVEQMDLDMEPLLGRVEFPAPSGTAGTDEADFPQARRTWWVTGVALAASITAAIVLFPRLASGRYAVITAPGERQTIVLDATTEVMLNGSTRMIFDRRNPRFAALESGEALFHVRHDSEKPFTLELGNRRVQDVGTVFNVVREPGEIRIAVAEGRVIYDSHAMATPLGPTQVLVDRSDAHEVRISAEPVAAVGAWQKGLFVYDDELLSQVAADLGRSLGIPVTVSPLLAERRFSGTITLNGSGPEQLDRLKLALNVEVEAGPAGWMLKRLDDGPK